MDDGSPMSDPPGCLGFLLGLLRNNSAESAEADLPEVRINKRFVTFAEADFFRVLRKVMGESAHVLAQVPIAQLLWFPGNNYSNPGRQEWRNRVAQRTVDFVICDFATLRPLVAIELDEPSHDAPDRQVRDRQVEAILKAAGLPLLRIKTARTYNTRELSDLCKKYVPPTPGI
jgi:hypothetical protein